GWALRDNQKLGNRGSDRIDAQAMYKELLEYVEASDIEKKDIPKITTIQNWINTYAHTFNIVLAIKYS
ncbi:17130_t:CDS:2, partial [Racocetra persica]